MRIKHMFPRALVVLTGACLLFLGIALRLGRSVGVDDGLSSRSPAPVERPLQLADVSAGLGREDAPIAEVAPDVIGRLAALIVEQDGERAGALAMAWFDAHADDPARALLELAADGERSVEESRAVGTLLRLGVHLFEHQPERMEPWTLHSFSEATIDLLGVHHQVPALLWTGFSSAGPDLAPEQLTTLLDAFRSRHVAAAPRDQAWCLQLGKRWAKTMPPGVEQLMLERAGDAASSETQAADAAAMLLARDWRSVTPELAAIAGEDRAASPGQAFKHIIGSHARDLSPLEQAEFFAPFSGSPGAALAIAWQMSTEGASMALAELGGEPGFAATVLALRAGERVPLDRTLELIANERLASAHPSLGWFAMEGLLRSDAAFEPALADRLSGLFQGSAKQRDRLYRTLAEALPSLEQEPLLAVVLPILDRSRGGPESREREILLRGLRARFPEMHLE